MDDPGSRSYLLRSAIIIAALVLGAAYFAVAETSFASVSRTRLKLRAERGEKRAIKALNILDRFDEAITTILIGTNITHIVAASVASMAVTRAFGLQWISLCTVVMTILVFFVGEMLPKSIAKKYSERLSLAAADSLYFFMTVLKPISCILSAIGRLGTCMNKDGAEKSVTEEEIYDIIEDMTEEGTLDSEQGELISSALQFGDITVESILTARVDLAAVNVDDPPEKLLAFIKEQRHSRLPVYEGSIDNVIGVLSIRKYLRAVAQQGVDQDIRSLMSAPYFVHQSTKIDDLLPLMSKQRLNMAVVTDNYGGTLGIVTVEDILEELVGEIWDEEDLVREPFIQLEDGVWDCAADETVADVLEKLDIEPDDGETDYTNKLFGEWAYEQFPQIPQVGDSFTALGARVTISEMEHSRILRATIRTERGEQA
ncbi:MAG: HlyC/CorC family transporter [Oscillospiraceae bacterium]|nr:HlyC/CorC family transporter [Oscillospiraceae bacterium]